MIIFMSLGLFLTLCFIKGAIMVAAGTLVITTVLSFVLTFVSILIFFKISNFIVEKFKGTTEGKIIIKQVKKFSEFDSENVIKIIAIFCLISITLIIIMGV